MDIYFVRHGDPDYEHDSLTEMGHFQAEKTAEELVKIPINKVFSSSMGRAMQTAKHLTEKTKQPITSFDWAREDRTWSCLYDINENGNQRWFFDVEKNKKILEKNIGNHQWYEYFPNRMHDLFVADGKEIDIWLRSLNIVHKDAKYELVGETPKKVVFFAHGGFGTVFFSHMLDLDYPSVLKIYGQQELCGVAHFRIDEKGIELLSYSKTYY